MLQSDNSPTNENPLVFPLKKEDTEFLFPIPKDYFLDFPEAMVQEIYAMEADEKTRNMPKVNPYDLNPNYFEGLSAQVLGLIKIEDSNTEHFIESLPKQASFAIPDNYFASFETALFQKLDLENIEEDDVVLSPLLAGLKNKQVFEVPEDYFDRPIKRTIEFKPRTAQRSIKWMRWAAAAMIIAIFSLGGAQLLIDTPVNTNSNYALVKEGINQISDAEIKAYLNATLNDYDVTMLAQNINWNTNPLDGISKEELKNYLEEGAY